MQKQEGIKKANFNFFEKKSCGKRSPLQVRKIHGMQSGKRNASYN